MNKYRRATMWSTNKPLLLLLLLLLSYYLLLNRNKCRGEFSHSEHSRFCEKKFSWKKKRHNNIKSERKLREKHLFCASFGTTIPYIQNPLGQNQPKRTIFYQDNILKMKLGHFLWG